MQLESAALLERKIFARRFTTLPVQSASTRGGAQGRLKLEANENP
jgi:hypothetical protein